MIDKLKSVLFDGILLLFVLFIGWYLGLLTATHYLHH